MKLTKFSDTHVFNAPVQGFALEFYNTFGNLAKKKTRMMPYQTTIYYTTMLAQYQHFMDRQTETVNIALCILAHADTQLKTFEEQYHSNIVSNIVLLLLFLESIQKRAVHIIFNFTRGLPYVCFVCCQPEFNGRQMRPAFKSFFPNHLSPVFLSPSPPPNSLRHLCYL